MDIADGDWHEVAVRRVGSYIQLSVDGGEGELSASSPARENAFSEINIDCTQIFLGAKVTKVAGTTNLITRDYQNGEEEEEEIRVGGMMFW